MGEVERWIIIALVLVLFIAWYFRDQDQDLVPYIEQVLAEQDVPGIPSWIPHIQNADGG